MAGALRQRLAESLRAFRAVFANPNLRRIELAWAGSETGKWLYLIALLVYAYDAGGVAAVGLVTLMRTLASALSAPFTALLGDRYRRELVMLVATVLRAGAMAGAAALVLFDGPPAGVYAIAALVTLLSTAFRPAQAALLPSLARTPEELTAANVAASTITSVGSFAGAALGGLLLAATSVEVCFAVTAATFLWAAALVGRIRSEAPPVTRAAARGGLARELSAGFRAIGRDRDLRVINLLYGAQTLVAGALNVLLVVTAFEVLEIGESGVGFLNSALGVGGLLGAVAALSLVGGGRLASAFMVGLVLWGAPLVALALWPNVAVALVLVAVIGVGDTLVDVAALTLLQRAVADEVLARVFGALETLVVAAMGLGAIAAPLLVEVLGERGALAATGAVLPVLGVLLWRRVSAIDTGAPATDARLALLAAVPIFAPLPRSVLEPLAERLVPLTVGAGDPVFREGDHGDRFYVVSDGEVDVAIDGRPVRTLGSGGYFGEIALLRDVPRTATVTGRGRAELLALDRDEFIAAVTGHAPSAEAADAVVATRLAAARSTAAAD